MKTLNKISVLFLTVFLSQSIVSCSSDSSSSAPATAPAVETLSGTAATGKALAGFIYVVDAVGTEVNEAINDDGNFSVVVTGMTPPYMVKVVPDDTSIAPLFSYASSGGAVNVTPMTNLAMFLASNNADLDTVFNSWDGSGITAININKAKKKINANLQPQFVAEGLDASTYDFFTRDFLADSTGLDKILDGLQVTVNPDVGSFSIKVDNVPFSFDESVDISDISLIGISGAVTFSGGAAVTIFSGATFNPDFAMVTESALNETETGIPDVTATTYTTTWTVAPIEEGRDYYTSISYTEATYESTVRYSLFVGTGRSRATGYSFVAYGNPDQIAGVTFNKATGVISFNNVTLLDPQSIVKSRLIVNGSLTASGG